MHVDQLLRVCRLLQHCSAHLHSTSSRVLISFGVHPQGVWASMYNERAMLSMKKVGIDFRDIRMAVLCQRVVQARLRSVSTVQLIMLPTCSATGYALCRCQWLSKFLLSSYGCPDGAGHAKMPPIAVTNHCTIPPLIQHMNAGVHSKLPTTAADRS